jgi:hypothetical protein
LEQQAKPVEVPAKQKEPKKVLVKHSKKRQRRTCSMDVRQLQNEDLDKKSNLKSFIFNRMN